MARHNEYHLLSYARKAGKAASEVQYGGVIYTLSSHFSMEQAAPKQLDVCAELAVHNHKQLQHPESQQ